MAPPLLHPLLCSPISGCPHLAIDRRSTERHLLCSGSAWWRCSEARLRRRRNLVGLTRHILQHWSFILRQTWCKIVCLDLSPLSALYGVLTAIVNELPLLQIYLLLPFLVMLSVLVWSFLARCWSGTTSHGQGWRAESRGNEVREYDRNFLLI